MLLRNPIVEKSQLNIRQKPTPDQSFKLFLGALFPYDRRDHGNKKNVDLVRLGNDWHEERFVQQWIDKFNQRQEYQLDPLIEYDVMIPPKNQDTKGEYRGVAVIGYAYELPNFFDQVDRIGFMDGSHVRFLPKMQEEVYKKLNQIGPREGFFEVKHPEIVGLYPWSSFGSSNLADVFKDIAQIGENIHELDKLKGGK